MAKSREETRCGCFEAVNSLWLHRGLNYIMATSTQALVVAKSTTYKLTTVLFWLQRTLRCCCIGARISLWLHRGSNLVLGTSRQQLRCCCIKAANSLWLYRGTSLVVTALSQPHRCSCIDVTTCGFQTCGLRQQQHRGKYLSF